jgi:hypothetical protein
MGGLLGPYASDLLGVSPVFTLQGVPYTDLMAFEAQCRQRPDMASDIRQALPWHPPDLQHALLTRPCFAPADEDYLDILNPVLGIAFHRWWQGHASTYSRAPVWIDGGNVARLPNGQLSFNGMVCPAPNLATALQWSRQGVMPVFLQQAMQAFQQFLQTVGGFKQARVIAPQQLYVRQTRHVLTRRMATAADLLAQQGQPSPAACKTGVKGLPSTAGPYTYWLDTRGIDLRQYVRGFTQFDKPLFYTDVAYTLCRKNPYMAVLGRSAGYGPLAQATCRIVQHNAWLAEVLAPVALMAAQQASPLQQVLAWRADAVLGDALPHPLAHLPDISRQLLQQEIRLLNQWQARQAKK